MGSGALATVGGFIGSGGGAMNNSILDADESRFYDGTDGVFTSGTPWDFVSSSARQIWLLSTTSLPRHAQASDVMSTMAGAGTEEDPFIITTVAEFNSVQSLPMLRSYFKLGGDLDFNTLTLDLSLIHI